MATKSMPAGTLVGSVGSGVDTLVLDDCADGSVVGTFAVHPIAKLSTAELTPTATSLRFTAPV